MKTFCKNTVLIVTTEGKTEKTRSKWANTGGMSNTVLIVTARLQLSSKEYCVGVGLFEPRGRTTSSIWLLMSLLELQSNKDTVKYHFALFKNKVSSEKVD